MKKFLARYSNKIRGVLSCFDRVVIRGTLPDICYAGKMEWQLRSRDPRPVRHSVR